MCGLVGIAGDLSLQDEATLKRLLVFDVFRGPHSTGLAVVKRDKSFGVSKIASHPLDLFDTKSFDRMLQYYNGTAFIGHNRFATVGAVNTINSHPFEFGHIVGAHNGTLDKASWRRLNESNGEETTVDSAAIFLSISKIGIEKTIELMEEGTTSREGAWALVWYDGSDNTLNFLRNKHRPFWISWEKDFKRLFWASEWQIIRAATDMCSKGYDPYWTKEGHRFFETVENYWYRIPVEELIAGSAVKPNFRHKKLEGRKPEVKRKTNIVPFHQPYTNVGPTTMGYPPTNGSNTSTHIELSGNSASPFGGVISEKQFSDFSYGGCQWCQGEVKWGDVGISVYTQEEIVLCNKCSAKPEKTVIRVNSVDFSTWDTVSKAG